MLREKLSLALNALIAVIVLTAWAGMVFARDERGVLTARGLASLRFFTVLSNLLAGLAALVWAVCILRVLAGAVGEVPRGALLLKYAGAVSVALTLMTVLLFLGPTAKTGFWSMFEGVNLWLHLVVPVLAVLDFCLLSPGAPLSLPDSLLACVPMALYAVYYLGNILRNGVAKGGRVNDWYGFLAHGIPAGVVIALCIFAGTWGMALLMRLARH